MSKSKSLNPLIVISSYLPHLGCLDFASLWPRGRVLWASAQHHQDGHHGWGAPHLRQPPRVLAVRLGTGVLHQHGLPGSHRGWDPHLHAGGTRGPKSGHEETELDPVLWGRQCGCWFALWIAGKGPDRKGHVGQAWQHFDKHFATLHVWKQNGT